MQKIIKSDQKVTVMTSKSDQVTKQKVVIDLEKCMKPPKPPVPNREGSRIRKSSEKSHRSRSESRTRKSSSVRFKVEKSSVSDSTKNLIDTRSEYSCSSIDLTTYV